MTTKHQKVLAMAATKTGATMEVYLNEARELQKVGLIEAREVFTTAGGNRKYRWFLKAA